ncbi:DUF2489 domain-containing protein [Marinagarivorans algicola]|uniref:DUF2489 domain-containing protein n=1 Tax=Marinagarivorans algicola TaxID=1513270 RepID=UPI0006B4637E|nr:DUF2489 domain-containing protein [Marinagarivorans algicola]
MFETMLGTLLFFVGLIIILLLAGMATFLHWQLHLRKKRDALLLAEQEAVMAKNREDALKSLHIIAKSYISGQVELGEAGIRVSRLMNVLGLTDAQRAPFTVFDQIHERLAHIPILQDWKALSKKEKFQHLKTINTVERDFKDFAVPAAKELAVFKIVEPAFYAV